jgi:signal transduction histidine kinase/ActR/RegA family two-component response regulator
VTAAHQKLTDPPAIVRRYSDLLRRWVTIAGIVLIVLIIAADTYEGWQDYLRVIADNEHLQVAMSRALTEQTARMLQEVDLVMSSYADSTLLADGLDGQNMRARFLSQIMRSPFIYSAAIANADGNLLAKSPKEPIEAANLKNLDVFSVPQHAGPDVFYIGSPLGSASSDSQTFALSRRLSSPGGAFAGAVIARVSSDYLTRFYARINVTPDTAIRLVRDDGVTLAQYAPGAAIVGTGRPELDGKTAGPDEQMIYSHEGGEDQIVISRRVVEYPIRVIISRSLSSVRQPWIREERSSAERTLSLALLAALLLITLRSALNRQERLDEEMYRLEQELAAIQRLDAVGLLAASVAHDFNNVLSAIIGYAELIRDSADTDLSPTSHVDRLLAATERARLLVKRVLTFDPHRSVSYRPTLIEPILVEVSQQVQASLPGSIELKLEPAHAALTISGDATEIHQVLMNLCSNAIHAMPGGGTLTLGLHTVEVREAQQLTLGQLLPGRWACASIVDTGIGLTDDQIESIFEPFYTTRNPSHGTGIGLTVVRNIILRMRGALKVESRLASGTRMAVFWPAVATPDNTGSEAGLEGAGAGETILIVDDERELVTLTEELLASLGYEPVGFSDARAALDAFRHNPGRFDAVLTDERMQPWDGLELAERIHKIEPRVPILLMTGHRDADIDRRAREQGIAEILDKPLRVQTLRQVLASQLLASQLRGRQN